MTAYADVLWHRRQLDLFNAKTKIPFFGNVEADRFHRNTPAGPYTEWNIFQILGIEIEIESEDPPLFHDGRAGVAINEVVLCDWLPLPRILNRGAYLAPTGGILGEIRQRDSFEVHIEFPYEFTTSVPQIMAVYLHGRRVPETRPRRPE